MREYFFDHEIFWNDVIMWALKHIHRAGGVHQHTFYTILEKCRKDIAKAQIALFEEYYHGEGWENDDEESTELE